MINTKSFYYIDKPDPGLYDPEGITVLSVLSYSESLIAVGQLITQVLWTVECINWDSYFFRAWVLHFATQDQSISNCDILIFSVSLKSLHVLFDETFQDLNLSFFSLALNIKFRFWYRSICFLFFLSKHTLISYCFTFIIFWWLLGFRHWRIKKQI